MKTKILLFCALLVSAVLNIATPAFAGEAPDEAPKAMGAFEGEKVTLSVVYGTHKTVIVQFANPAIKTLSFRFESEKWVCESDPRRPVNAVEKMVLSEFASSK